MSVQWIVGRYWQCLCSESWIDICSVCAVNCGKILTCLCSELWEAVTVGRYWHVCAVNCGKILTCLCSELWEDIGSDCVGRYLQWTVQWIVEDIDMSVQWIVGRYLQSLCSELWVDIYLMSTIATSYRTLNNCPWNNVHNRCIEPEMVSIDRRYRTCHSVFSEQNQFLLQCQLACNIFVVRTLKEIARCITDRLLRNYFFVAPYSRHVQRLIQFIKWHCSPVRHCLS